MMFKDGNLVGTVMQPIEVLDNKGLRFKRDGETLLELLVSDTTISVDTNLLSKENVYEWLWQQGKGIAVHLKTPKRIKLYHYDINGSTLASSIDNLEAKDIPSREELEARKIELLQSISGFSSEDNRHISETEDEIRQIDVELERYE